MELQRRNQKTGQLRVGSCPCVILFQLNEKLSLILSWPPPLHVLCSQKYHLLHVIYNHIIIQDPRCEAFSEVHDMAQIDGHILLLCQLNNIPGTIIATGGCIEHLIRAVLNKQKSLSASRQHYGRDQSQHRTFNEMLVDDLRFIHTLDDGPCKFVADSLVAVGVLKIYLCIVNSFRHIAKVDIEHGIITFQLVGIYC